MMHTTRVLVHLASGIRVEGATDRYGSHQELRLAGDAARAQLLLLGKVSYEYPYLVLIGVTGS